MMVRKEINYSIIIPHKNIPDLLRRCLASIPKRNDTEIIIVDDNSSPELVDFQKFPGYDRTDVHLVFDKKGGGGGYARNIGLKYARGRWILFADADDFFNYCINDILDEYIDSGYGVIYFNANSVDTYNYSISHRADHVNHFFNILKYNYQRGELLFRYKFGEPWGKLIKADLIRNKHILFDEIPIHNDTTFSYQVGFYANDIYIDDRCLYCITVRSGSVSKSISPDKLLIRIHVFGLEYMFLKKNHIPVREDLHFRELLIFIYKGNWNYLIEGLHILRNMGLKRKEIVLGIIDTFFYRLIRKILSLRFKLDTRCI